jgi:hypothetical protein
MLWVFLTGRNGMHIDIKNLRADKGHGEAGLFFCFTLGHRRGVWVSITVTTELQPHVELTVMGQQ